MTEYISVHFYDVTRLLAARNTVAPLKLGFLCHNKKKNSTTCNDYKMTFALERQIIVRCFRKYLHTYESDPCNL